MTVGGRVWFAVQFVIFIAMIAAPIVQRWDVPVYLRVLGVLVSTGGLLVAVAGYRGLAGSHSPGTTPTAGAHLVSNGIYAHQRHPIYAGWLLGAFGLALIFGSLLGLGIAIVLLVYYDLRTREEEKHLLQSYPGYRAYMARVRRFVPGVY